MAARNQLRLSAEARRPTSGLLQLLTLCEVWLPVVSTRRDGATGLARTTVQGQECILAFLDRGSAERAAGEGIESQLAVNCSELARTLLDEAAAVVLIVSDGEQHLSLTPAEVRLLAGRDPQTAHVRDDIELTAEELSPQERHQLALLVQAAPEVAAIHLARAAAAATPHLIVGIDADSPPAQGFLAALGRQLRGEASVDMLYLDEGPLSRRLRAIRPIYTR